MDGIGTQKADVIWRDGDVPVSVLFDDPYFSRADGLAETRHVFLAGNGLPERFRPGFHVAELGFGCGLNALAAATAWAAAGMAGALRFTSFEAWPMDAADMARALAGWPELAPLAAPLVAAWSQGARRIALPGRDLEIIEGDARETLPAWTGSADAWFLDGFSPARNPELWEPALLAQVARRSAPGGTFATYSAASAIRESLAAAGFDVIRAPGFGAKKHMSRGVLRAS
jgi:tRNA U34 5-methylaminomethyl-2-thiouridine-forming methyltransferase MnmC